MNEDIVEPDANIEKKIEDGNPWKWYQAASTKDFDKETGLFAVETINQVIQEVDTLEELKEVFSQDE